MMVTRALDVYNLHLNKKIEESSVVIQLGSQDSIRIQSPDCEKFMMDQSLSVGIRTQSGMKMLEASDFDRWIGVDGENEQIELVFQRSQKGEKVLLVRNLKLFRKYAASAGNQEIGNVLQFNNFSMDAKLGEKKKSAVAVRVRAEDQLKVEVGDAGQNQVVCKAFSKDNETVGSSLTFGEPMGVELSGGKFERYFLEFSPVEKSGKSSPFDLAIQRIPATPSK